MQDMLRVKLPDHFIFLKVNTAHHADYVTLLWLTMVLAFSSLDVIDPGGKNFVV